MKEKGYQSGERVNTVNEILELSFAGSPVTGTPGESL